MATSDQLINPDGKLKTLAVIWLAVRGTIAYRRELTRIIWFPLTVSIALDLLLHLIEPSDRLASEALWAAAYWPIMIWFLGPVYRFIWDIRSGQPPILSCQLRRHDIRLALALFALWLVPFIAFDAFYEFYSDYPVFAQILALTALILCIYIYCRMSVTFPAAATGRSARPGNIWALTRSNGMRLLILQALALVPVYAVQLPIDQALEISQMTAIPDVLARLVRSLALAPIWAVGLIITAAAETLALHALIEFKEGRKSEANPDA